MKRFLYLKVLVLALLVVTIGCKPGGGGDEDMEIRLAPIHEVQVNIAESYPPQIFVFIKGGLPDACTTLHKTNIGRHDNTIDITVSIKRLKGKICAQIYSYFEENVALGSDFASGEIYTVNVNEYKPITFALP